MPWRSAGLTATLFAMSILAATAAPSAAQLVRKTRLGVGYVAAAPDLMIGGNAYALLPLAGGLGIYVDAKLDASNPRHKSNFLAGLTAQQAESKYGDDFGLSTDSWRAFDLAIMRPLRPSLIVYAGGGYAGKTRYNEYYDRTGSRGLVGHYWVEDPRRAGNTVNLMGGVFLRMSRFLNAQFGAESAPGSVTVGVSLALPPL